MTSTESPKPNLLQLLVHMALWLWHPVIACFELPMRGGRRDLEMAAWLWHCDPNQARGRTCAVGYMANAGYKISLRSIVPVLLIGLLVGLFGPNMFPALTLMGCVLVAFLAMGFGTAVTATLFAAAMCLALRNGVRLWLDGEPDLGFAKSNWPPVRSDDNVYAFHSLQLVLVIFMVGVMAAPEKWMYEAAACCLLYTSPSPRDKRQSRMPSSA